MNSFHYYVTTKPNDVNPYGEVFEYLVLIFDNHSDRRSAFFEQHF